MNLEEKAVALFNQGYNCSQSVFCAYADEYDIPLQQAAKISSSFGGGMGHLGETCGALTGAFMALGLGYGNGEVVDKATKERHYQAIKELGEAFKAAKGSTRCDDLLATNQQRATIVVDGVTVKACEHLVRQAVRLVEEYRFTQKQND